MRSSKNIIKNSAQKVVDKFGFGLGIHDLKYFEVGIFLIFLEFIINLRAPFIEKHHFNVILSLSKHILDNYMYNIATYTLFLNFLLST